MSKGQKPKLSRVTNFENGLRNIRTNADVALVNLKDTDSPFEKENILYLERARRYSITDADKKYVNLETVLGDVFSALCNLDDRLKKLEDKIDCVSNTSFARRDEVERHENEIHVLSMHIMSLENNLRVMRETLILGDYEEEEVPVIIKTGIVQPTPPGPPPSVESDSDEE